MWTWMQNTKRGNHFRLNWHNEINDLRLHPKVKGLVENYIDCISVPKRMQSSFQVLQHSELSWEQHVTEIQNEVIMIVVTQCIISHVNLTCCFLKAWRVKFGMQDTCQEVGLLDSESFLLDSGSFLLDSGPFLLDLDHFLDSGQFFGIWINSLDFGKFL